MIFVMAGGTGKSKQQKSNIAAKFVLQTWTNLSNNTLLFLVISTFALLMYFSILKWKNSRKRSLLMVILQHLWIVVSNNFLIKCITLEIKFILALKRLNIFVFLSLVIMVCKFDHNFRNFFLLLIHIFPYVSSFVLLSVFRTSFHLRTKFPVN